MRTCKRTFSSHTLYPSEHLSRAENEAARDCLAYLLKCFEIECENDDTTLPSTKATSRKILRAAAEETSLEEGPLGGVAGGKAVHRAISGGHGHDAGAECVSQQSRDPKPGVVHNQAQQLGLLPIAPRSWYQTMAYHQKPLRQVSANSPSDNTDHVPIEGGSHKQPHRTYLSKLPYTHPLVNYTEEGRWPARNMDMNINVNFNYPPSEYYYSSYHLYGQPPVLSFDFSQQAQQGHFSFDGSSSLPYVYLP